MGLGGTADHRFAQILTVQILLGHQCFGVGCDFGDHQEVIDGVLTQRAHLRPDCRLMVSSMSAGGAKSIETQSCLKAWIKRSLGISHLGFDWGVHFYKLPGEQVLADGLLFFREMISWRRGILPVTIIRPLTIALMRKFRKTEHSPKSQITKGGMLKKTGYLSRTLGRKL